MNCISYYIRSILKGQRYEVYCSLGTKCDQGFLILIIIRITDLLFIP